MTPPDFMGVAMDTHIYQVFSDGEVAESEQDHINSACSHSGDLASFDLWTIVGEFAYLWEKFDGYHGTSNPGVWKRSITHSRDIIAFFNLSLIVS